MKGSAPPPGWPVEPPKPLLLHAKATRSAHFQTLLHDGTATKLGVVTVTGACLFAVIEGEASSLLFGLVAAPLIVLLALAGMADRRAAADFFQSYAAARGLSHAAKGELVPVTPLLAAGDRRSAEHVMKGPLQETGRRHTLAWYTYEVRSSIGDDRDDYDAHPFTVSVIDVPEAFPLFAGVYLARRGKLGDHDWLRGGGRRDVELESVEFNRLYRLRVSDAQDPGVVRELFAPALVMRMVDRPMRLGMELGAGGLCVYAPGKLEELSALDRFVAGARELLEHVEREIAERTLIGR